MYFPLPPNRNSADGESGSQLIASIDPLVAKELRAFVGPNSEYYLRHWAAQLAGREPSASFNLAAFFLAGFWLPYRKMCKATFLLFGIIIAEGVLEQAIFVGGLRMSDSPPGMTPLICLLIGVVCGLFGNRWYLSHCQRVIQLVRAEGLSDEAQLRLLAKRGGTSLFASIGLFAILITALMVLSVAADRLFNPA